jgi:hypothetical protein
MDLKEFPELELTPIEIDLPEPNLEPELDSFLSQWVDCLSRGIEDSFDLSKPPSVGRPKRITPGVLAKFESAYSLGCNDREACNFAGVNPATLYRYQNKTPEFSSENGGYKTGLY